MRGGGTIPAADGSSPSVSSRGEGRPGRLLLLLLPPKGTTSTCSPLGFPCPALLLGGGEWESVVTRMGGPEGTRPAPVLASALSAWMGCAGGCRCCCSRSATLTPWPSPPPTCVEAKSSLLCASLTGDPSTPTSLPSLPSIPSSTLLLLLLLLASVRLGCCLYSSCPACCLALRAPPLSGNPLPSLLPLSLLAVLSAGPPMASSTPLALMPVPLLPALVLPSLACVHTCLVSIPGPFISRLPAAPTPPWLLTGSTPRPAVGWATLARQELPRCCCCCCCCCGG